jgi:G3E family GTPase
VETLELTLRAARGPAAQQAAIDTWLDLRRQRNDQRTAAVVAEGAFFALRTPPDVPLVRLAAGCPCCTGALPLRVALVRLARRARPQCLLLLVTDGAHAERVRTLAIGGALGLSFVEER